MVANVLMTSIVLFCLARRRFDEVLGRMKEVGTARGNAAVFEKYDLGQICVEWMFG